MQSHEGDLVQPDDPDLAPAEHETSLPASESISRGHEDLAVSIRGVVISTVALLTLIIVPMVVVWLYLRHAANDTATANRVMPSAWDDQGLPSGPPLFANQPDELRALRASEKRQLSSTGWIDQQQGIAHIPIEQAIQLIAEHGLPQWAAEAEEEEPQDEAQPQEIGRCCRRPWSGQPGGKQYTARK